MEQPATHKPFYKSEGITIINDDCLKHLHEIKGGTIVTDPPYNVGYHYDECKDDMSRENYWQMIENVTSGRPSVLIHYPEAMFEFAAHSGRLPERIVAWVYPSNTPRQHRSVAWFGCKPDFRLDGQDYRNPTDPRIAKRIAEGKMARLYDWWEINQVKNVSSEKTEHPCQIPLALMLRVLKITKPRLVIEPFLGSGTTLLAASILGIPAIGFDISSRYCEIAANRIANHKPLI
jgi:adenine-specific DNA-methyltransferase